MDNTRLGEDTQGGSAREAAAGDAPAGVRRPLAAVQQVPWRSERRDRIGNEEHYEWLRRIVMAILVLNLLDAIFTLFWVQTGYARERNALLEPFVIRHSGYFTFVKLSLVSLGIGLLWNRRHHASAVVAIFVAFVAYYAVVAFHFSGSGMVIHRFLSE